VSAAFDGKGNLYVVDSGNNRVLGFPQQPPGVFVAATRLLGQPGFQYNSLNWIDGREVGFSANIGGCSVNGSLPFVSGGDAVIDGTSTPPHLYVADPLNNRVLGYLDYRKVNADVKADLVLGQPDLLTALVNYPSNSPTQANAQGLWSPEGLAVDSNGNLYVADTCNARSAVSSALRAEERRIADGEPGSRPDKSVWTAHQRRQRTDHDERLWNCFHCVGWPGGFRSAGESRSLLRKDGRRFSIRGIREQRIWSARFQHLG
jgi:hypothetical protein